MNRIFFFITVFFVHAASGQDISQGIFPDPIRTTVDTAQSVKWYKSKAFRIAAVPTLLIGYSLTIMEGHGLTPSQDVYDYRQEHYPDFHTTADNYLVATPAVMMYGLDLAGVKSRNDWVNQTFIIVMSQAINLGLVTATKALTKVERPDHSNDNSYPSGHTSSAFAMAEVLHQEFKEKSVWISVAGYSSAAAVGALRILNNKHWLSDVVGGAGFGILSAKLTYVLYPKIRKSAKGL